MLMMNLSVCSAGYRKLITVLTQGLLLLVIVLVLTLVCPATCAITNSIDQIFGGGQRYPAAALLFS